MPAEGESKAPVTGLPSGQADRRRDPLFRSPIDEMMQQIRELRAHAGPWPVEEREPPLLLEEAEPGLRGERRAEVRRERAEGSRVLRHRALGWARS